MHSTSSHRCFGTGNTCPSSKITGCSHSEDVTVQCCKIQYSNTLNSIIPYLAYSSSYSRSSNTKTTCKGLISKYFTSSSFIIIIIKVFHLIEL